MDRLLTEHNLRIFHAELNDCNGGSSRIFACHQAADFATTSEFDSLRSEEASLGLDRLEPYAAFAERVDAMRKQVRAYFAEARRLGKRVYGYGASTKGNTTLQYCGIGPDDIVAVADRNPSKDGLVLPGTRIPICMEAEARADEPDVFFVLPWHFREEFIDREAAFLDAGGELLFPLPAFERVVAPGRE